MATKHLVKNFSLPPALCESLEAQAEIEDRPMSRIVSRALAEYLALHQAAAQDLTISSSGVSAA